MSGGVRSSTMTAEILCFPYRAIRGKGNKEHSGLPAGVRGQPDKSPLLGRIETPGDHPE